MLAAVLCLTTGCTLFDDVLPGTPFTPDQPAAAVTLVGIMNVDPSSGTATDCPSGRTLLWGLVRNSGDFDLEDVFIEIDAFDASGRLLGTYRVNVFGGDVTAADEETTIDTASTSLEVDQAGPFEVCTSIPYGSVARTDYRTSYCYTLRDEVVCE